MTATFVPDEVKHGRFTIAFTLVIIILIGLGLSGISELAGIIGVMMGVFLIFYFVLNPIAGVIRP